MTLDTTPAQALTPEQDAAVVTDVQIKGETTEPAAPGMKATLGELPKDFDFKAESIAKIAMMDNDTHPDLIGACRSLLVNAAVPADKLAIFDSHFLIVAAKGKSLLAQRQALNSFWTVQFAQFGTDGYGPRQLLAQVGDDKEWIKWFSTQPLDLIIAKGLPSNVN